MVQQDKDDCEAAQHLDMAHLRVVRTAGARAGTPVPSFPPKRFNFTHSPLFRDQPKA
jgi:hypothetical protein